MAATRWAIISALICCTYALPAVKNVVVPSTPVNVNETVREVQLLLEKNPNLPRLTRGEILDIIDNITKTDAQREREQKAIMLVMPYSPNSGANGNIEDLYTKPPVTQIIDSDNNPTTPVKPKVTRKPYSKPTKEPEIYVTKPRPQRTRKTTTTQISVTTTEEKQIFTTPVPVTSSSTVRYTRRQKPNRGTPKYPNHKYSGEETDNNTADLKDGIRIIDPPKHSPGRDPINADYWHSQKSSVIKNPKPVYQAKVVTPTTKRPELDDIVPDHLKDVVKDMDLILGEPKQPNVPSKYSSQYDANNGFVRQKPPMKENVKDLLASIGLHPQDLVPSTTTTTESPNAHSVVDSLSPDMRELLKSFGLLPEPGDAQPAPAEKPKTPKVVDNSYTGAVISPDSYVSFKPLPDTAPSRDDMNAFLSGYGLGTGRNQKALKNQKDAKPELSVDMVPDDFQGLLKDLGITDESGNPIKINSDDSNRTPKKIRSESVIKTSEKVVEKNTEKPQHVFNPAEPPYATNEEMKKLEKLLNVIKKLESLNRTATQDDLSSAELENIKELTESLNNDNYIPLDQQEGGPDPLNFDNSFEKNEVKRQEPKGGSSTTAAPSEFVETISVTTVTEEARNPSLIADLEDSFGGPSSSGSSTTELPRPTEPPSPPARKTGFYYLLDWNSFLDVDNTKGKRVNVRFEPKVGDPSRFISVSVP